MKKNKNFTPPPKFSDNILIFSTLSREAYYGTFISL